MFNSESFSIFLNLFLILKPESDGSRSGSSLSLRNIAGNDAAAGGGGGATSSVQSPTHRGVHRSISASSTKPSRRASSGAETLREFNHYFLVNIAKNCYN